MKKLKIKLLNYIIRHLFNGITENDVLRNYKGKFFIGRHEVPEVRIKAMIAEAKAMQKTELWGLLIKDMKLLSNQKMYERSQTVDDMIFGKAMLFITEILDKKVKNISNIQDKDLKY